MSIIDPEEGHFNDVDGRGGARASARARSVGSPEQEKLTEKEELAEQYPASTDEEPPGTTGSAEPSRAHKRTARHRK